MAPHITNQLIKEALHPYPEQLRIVTKVGARREAEGNWPRALEPDGPFRYNFSVLATAPCGGLSFSRWTSRRDIDDEEALRNS